MLKAVTGFVAPRAGRIRFAGQDITGTRADRLAPLGLAYVPQGRIVFPQMSVEENLDLGAFTLSSAARKRESCSACWPSSPPGGAPLAAGGDDVRGESRCWPSPAG